MEQLSDQVLRDFLEGKLLDDEQQAVERLLVDSKVLRSRLERLSSQSALGPDRREHKPIQGAAEHSKNTIPSLSAEQRAMAIDTPSHSAAAPIPDHPQHTVIEQIHIAGIKIQRELGRGGMGVVYEGLDTDLGRQVAVKVLSPHLAGDRAAVERMLREAQAAAQLQHENIVAIHSVQQIDHAPVLVQQYVPGESLRQRLQREKQLPVADLTRLALHVARGLAAAHARGVIHRDLKPDNILLDREADVARIADFGLAKLSGVTAMTQHGVLAGTPAYMSPEQACGKPLDGRSDLFSFGMVLYTAASGQLPFDADDPYVVLDKIKHNSAAPLPTLRPDLPDWFCAIVARLMAKRREDRIGSARELVGLIEREVSPRPLKSRARKTALRLAAIAALGVAGVWLGRFAWDRGNQYGNLTIGRSTLEKSPNAFESASTKKEVVPAGQFKLAGQSYSTLAEAIGAASDGSTILVSGNGPYLVDTLSIADKRLAIQAVPGSVPVFRPAVPGKDAPHRFLISNVDLTLKGLHVDWPVELPPLYTHADNVSAVVTSTGGRLTIDHCFVSCGRGGFCVGAGGSDLVLSRSILDAGDVCIGWYSKDDSVTVEHCLLRGREAFVLVPPGAATEFPRSPKLNLKHVTLIADEMFDIVLFHQPKRPISIDLQDCVIDCKSIVRFIGMPALRRDIFESPGMLGMLRFSISWAEQRCIHRRGTLYLSSRRPRQPKNIFKSSFGGPNEWFQYWKLAGTNSIEADLRATSIGTSLPDQLHEIHAPSGMIPSDCGANAKEIGPI